MIKFLQRMSYLTSIDEIKIFNYLMWKGKPGRQSRGHEVTNSPQGFCELYKHSFELKPEVPKSYVD